jgi:hypothetical protein
MLLENTMQKSPEEVVDILDEIYAENFAGKEKQRYLIPMDGLMKLHGLLKMPRSRFEALAECAENEGLYLIDLGEGISGHPIAVVKCSTVNRWRQVPKKVIERYSQIGANIKDENDEDE